MNTNDPTELDLAAQAWLESKADEQSANLRRIEAEARILALVGAKEEGATTVKTEWFKVQTTGKLTRTLQADKLAEVFNSVPADLYGQVIKSVPSLNLSALRAVEKTNPESYKAFCRAIVTKPAKAAVSVELLGAK